MDIYFKFDILGEKDYRSLEKYYTDSMNPEQVAKTDMTQFFNDRSTSHYADFYNLNLNLVTLSVKGDKAAARIGGSCSNSFGSGMGMGHSLQLIKKEGKWFVTGLSTFPDSAEYRKVSSMLPGIVKDIKSGKLFQGKLKGAEITTGQLQFWQLSDPHLAEESGYANYCKIYLHVKSGDGEKDYKLVLDKKNHKNWTPTILDDQRLSSLF
jgi:hypothetical protein